ncbi:MAG: hypothetical protein ACO1OQ_01095 [Rufibacter sp.]
MKKNFSLLKLLAMLLLAFSFQSCSKEDDPEPENEESNIPETFMGRDVDVNGTTVYVTSKNVSISVWDNGGVVDGDIVSIYVNGEKVIDQHELTRNKHTVDVTLKYKGYNYIMLYAHNEGWSPPNTCAVEINDGEDNQTIVLDADLQTNGAANIVVE